MMDNQTSDGTAAAATPYADQQPSTATPVAAGAAAGKVETVIDPKTGKYTLHFICPRTTTQSTLAQAPSSPPPVTESSWPKPGDSHDIDMASANANANANASASAGANDGNVGAEVHTDEPRWGPTHDQIAGAGAGFWTDDLNPSSFPKSLDGMNSLGNNPGSKAS